MLPGKRGPGRPRKNTIQPAPPPEPAPEPAPPAARRVRTVRTEEFNEPIEVAAVEVEPEPEPEDDYIDPFALFGEYVSEPDSCKIHIWLLPHYDKNRKVSANGGGRIYRGTIAYEPENDSMLEEIQTRVPEGGTVVLELRERGSFKNQGLLHLGAQPEGPPPPAPGPPPYVPPPGPSAGELFDQQLVMFERFTEAARKMIPPPPTLAVDNGKDNKAPTDERPFEDRLLETVVMKALDSDKPSGTLDKVLDAIGGRGQKAPGFGEQILILLAPALNELAKAAIPFLQSYIATMTQAGAPQKPAGPEPPAAAAQLPPAQPPSPAAAGGPTAPAIDPVQRNWMRTIIRILENCEEQARVAEADTSIELSVEPSAIEVAELYFRFNNELGMTVDAILAAEPVGVFELCALVMPAQLHQAIAGLQSQPAAVAWVARLQARIREVIAENQGGDDDEPEPEPNP